MKVVYYYRGRTGSAGFLLPEDMALLKRLFAHGSLPPKAQLRGKRCWLYLRVNTNNPAADEIGISGQDTYLRQFAEVNSMQIVGVYKDYMCGWDLRRPSLRFLAREAAEKKMDYILSCKQDRIYRGHDLRGLLQYEDHMHALGVDILYPFEQDYKWASYSSALLHRRFHYKFRFCQKNILLKNKSMSMLNQTICNSRYW